MNRARFLRFLSAGALAGTARAADHRPGAPLLSVGVLTDCQYADVATPPNSKRLYRESPKKLAAAITHLNAMGDLDFMLHLGDAVDRDAQSYEVVMPLFARAAVPLYHVAGNHDYDIAAALKTKVPALLGMNAPHYSFVRRGWRFVMLDGNELSTFAWPPGSAELQAAQDYLKAAPRKLATYSGGLGAKLLVWLVSKQKMDLTGTAKAGGFSLRTLTVMVGWAAVCAVVFSAVHYIGPMADSFQLASFLFRMVLGLALTLIFATRGFAAAVWTHALYDVWVLVFR